MGTNELITREYFDLNRLYPKLKPPYYKNGFWIIEGEYDLFDCEGIFHEMFEIEIKIPPEYPNAQPLLFETSHKIPKEIDWHVTQWGCCLAPEAVVFHRLGKIDLLRWFQIFVESFFANYVYKKNNENEGYPSGEFAHGIPGVVDGYKEIFGLRDTTEVLELLHNLIYPPKLQRNAPCYCKSGLKFKKCGLTDSVEHKKQYRIPLSRMKTDFKAIVEEYNQLFI
jgi:hypothetical protein